MNAIESGVFEGLEKCFFGEGSGDASAPEFGIVLEVFGYFFIADDVGDDGAPAFFQYPEDFLKELRFPTGVDEIEDAIGDDGIDRIAFHKRVLDAKVSGDLVGAQEGIGVLNGIGFEFAVEEFEIEREVLDTAFAELDIGIADALGDDGGVAACDFEHGIGHINADDFSFGADDLRSDETNLTGAASEIENCFPGFYILTGVAAAIIFFDNFFWNNFEIFRVVVYRTT